MQQSLSSSVELTQLPLPSETSTTTIDHKYMKIRVHIDDDIRQFQGNRALNPPDTYLVNMMMNPLFIAFEAIVWSATIIILTIWKTSSIEPKALGLLFAVPFLMSVPIEACFMDTHLLKQLRGKFQYWFLMSIIFIHVITLILNYNLSSIHKNTVEAEHTIYRAAPVYLISYVFALHLDAYVWRMKRWAKIVILITLNLNGVRWFMYSWLFDGDFDRLNHEYQVLPSISFGSISRSTFVTVQIFVARFLYLMLKSKQNVCMLLSVRKQMTFCSIQEDISKRRWKWYETSLRSDDHFDADDGTVYVDIVDPRVHVVRCEHNDCVLRSDFLSRIGSHKYYVVVLAMWILAVVLLGIGSPNLPLLTSILLSIPSIVFVAIEFSTRVLRALFLEVIQTFEYHFLLIWNLLWFIALHVRASKSTDPEESNEFMQGFISVQVFLLMPAVFSLDAFVGYINSFLVKKIVLTLALVNLTFTTVYTYIVPRTSYNICLLWCTDTVSLIQSSRVYLIIFCAKYLHHILTVPNHFLILTAPLHVRVIRQSNM